MIFLESDNRFKHVFDPKPSRGQMKSSPIRSTADLARALGLSRWTVSRALNGHGDISPDTAKRIRTEAARRGFSPSQLGRSLRCGRTDLVGVCVPDPEDYFLTTKISLIQRRLSESGLHVLLQIAGSAGEEASAIRRFAAMQCAGWITMASRSEEEEPSGLATEIPVVHVDPLCARTGLVVRTDRYRAMRLAVKHLHRRGCRRLVTAGIAPDGSGYAGERLRGIREEAARWRWDMPPHFLCAAGNDDFETGTLAAAEFLKRARRGKTGVIALNDRVAFAMAQALSSEGLRIPESVALIGYDNSDLARVSSPALTSIDPRADSLIRAAVTLLLKGLKGNPHPEQALLRPRLILRASS